MAMATTTASLIAVHQNQTARFTKDVSEAISDQRSAAITFGGRPGKWAKQAQSFTRLHVHTFTQLLCVNLLLPLVGPSASSNMRLPVKPSEFMDLGARITHRAGDRCFATEYRRYRAFFGCSPSTTALIWGKIRTLNLAPRSRPQHLLSALMSMNLYDTETVMAGFLGVDEETFSNHAFAMVQTIARLKPYYIKWENRHMGDKGVRAKTSVDGTDFLLPQQYPKKKFFSHKFKRSGFRYEVALCIQTGYIVWINGPFPCGFYPDITIFRLGLRQKLLKAREKAQADLGYRGEPDCIILPNRFDSDAIKQLKADCRARHETVNNRFKRFECLRRMFRHDISKHKAYFEAVVVLTQAFITNNEPLYQVQYGNLPLDAWRAKRIMRWNGTRWMYAC